MNPSSQPGNGTVALRKHIKFTKKDQTGCQDYRQGWFLVQFLPSFNEQNWKKNVGLYEKQSPLGKEPKYKTGKKGHEHIYSQKKTKLRKCIKEHKHQQEHLSMQTLPEHNKDTG